MVSEYLRASSGNADACVFLGVRAQQGCLGEPGKSLSAVSMSAVSNCRSVPAIGRGQQPQRLVCPGDRNRGEWNPGANTGQTEYQRPAAGGNLHCTYTCTCIFFLVDFHIAQKGSRMRPLVLSMYM